MPEPGPHERARSSPGPAGPEQGAARKQVRSAQPGAGARVVTPPSAGSRDVSIPTPAAPTPGRTSGTPVPQRGANPKQERRKGRCQPPPPFATPAVSPAPTAAGAPAPAPAETEALPLTAPPPAAEPARAPAPPPLPRPGVQKTRLRTPDRRREASWGLESSRAVDYDSHKALRPLLRPAPSPPASSRHPDYISRQPSRLSRPPSGDTSRTGRQVGEPVGFPLAAAAGAAAPRSDSPASAAAGAVSPTPLGGGTASPGSQNQRREPHITSARATPPPPGPPSPCAAARAPSPGWPRSRIPARILSEPPPLARNMDSDSCAAAFHPEVSEAATESPPTTPSAILRSSGSRTRGHPEGSPPPSPPPISPRRPPREPNPRPLPGPVLGPPRRASPPRPPRALSSGPLRPSLSSGPPLSGLGSPRDLPAPPAPPGRPAYSFPAPGDAVAAAARPRFPQLSGTLRPPSHRARLPRPPAAPLIPRAQWPAPRPLTPRAARSAPAPYGSRGPLALWGPKSCPPYLPPARGPPPPGPGPPPSAPRPRALLAPPRLSPPPSGDRPSGLPAAPHSARPPPPTEARRCRGCGSGDRWRVGEGRRRWSLPVSLPPPGVRKGFPGLGPPRILLGVPPHPRGMGPASSGAECRRGRLPRGRVGGGRPAICFPRRRAGGVDRSTRWCPQRTPARGRGRFPLGLRVPDPLLLVPRRKKSSSRELEARLGRLAMIFASAPLGLEVRRVGGGGGLPKPANPRAARLLLAAGGIARDPCPLFPPCFPPAERRPRALGR
ncbi:hypothetical protein P7K49_015345 [Saguinus oedipus]|uniref:Basic proline-rich protein-like n=1 Tax=Saguinus oedipus TaxID=9490 RepID=A0ABQ9V9I9_SAGOE|nr:hypothetical protein P7K49_015345 [Saguinus oedipus]